MNAQGDNNVQTVTSAPLSRGDPALRCDLCSHKCSVEGLLHQHRVQSCVRQNLSRIAVRQRPCVCTQQRQPSSTDAGTSQQAVFYFECHVHAHTFHCVLCTPLFHTACTGSLSGCRWPAILGIVLGGLLVASLCGGVFARKRTRRLYGVRPRTLSLQALVPKQ